MLEGSEPRPINSPSLCFYLTRVKHFSTIQAAHLLTRLLSAGTPLSLLPTKAVLSLDSPAFFLCTALRHTPVLRQHRTTRTRQLPAVSLGFDRVPQACTGAGAGGSATMHDPTRFQVVTPKERMDVRTLTDVQAYLQSVTLEALLAQLKDKGITQKAFAEQLGMHTRHLAAMKSSA